MFKESSGFKGWKPLPVIHYPAKFGVVSHCVSGYIMSLVCHVIPNDNVIKSSCDFMSESPS